MNLNIKTKIILAIILPSILLVMLSMAALQSIVSYDEKAAAMRRSSDQAILAEQVNGLINAVVMDSRGIYMSDTVEVAGRFAPPLLANLKLIEQALADWQPLVAPNERPTYAAAAEQAQKFVQFRRELVRLGLEVNPAQARLFGDNDANRTNRQALNKAVQALAEANAKKLVQYSQEVASYREQRVLFFIVVTGIGVIVGIGIAAVVATTISRPLVTMIGNVEKVAAGDTAVEIADTTRRDEIGKLGRALRVFAENAQQMTVLRAEQARQVLEGQAQQREFILQTATRIEHAVEEMVQSLVSASADMSRVTDTMTLRLKETRSQAQTVAVGSQQTSTQISDVATAIEQLTSSIAEVGEQSTNSLAIARSAVLDAQRADETILGLSTAAQRVQEVVGIISAIAAQTNLLALNATIEAARAGEAGKGFAVVASEVKSLANQTAKATDDISQQINAIQTAVNSAVDVVRKVGSVIQTISSSTETISNSVQEQTNVTRDIALTTVQIDQSATRVAENTAQVSKSVDDSGKDAHNVQESSLLVQQRTQKLMQDVGQLLTELRRQSAA